MKKLFTNLKVAMTLLLLCGVCSVWAADVTYVFKDASGNPGNSGDWFSATIDSYTSWKATKGGSNNPKYYDAGTGLRVYNGGTFKIESSKTIASITLTFSGTGYTFSSGNTDQVQTVEPNAKSYSWDVSRTCRLQQIEITYKADANQVATPTFSPTGNDTYFDAIDVTLASETAEAIIYYTTDGTTPTEASNQYTEPFNVSATTTVKAIAMKTGMSNSSVASKTFTFGPSFGSLEELVAAEITSGTTVKVTFENALITEKGTVYVYLNVQKGGKNIEIYSKGNDVSSDWKVGGKLSGTVIAPWTYYSGGGVWELCPTSWDGISYTEPSSEKYDITIDSDIQNGSVSVSGGLTEAVEGTTITLGHTPNAHCLFEGWNVYKTSDADTKVVVTDNKFSMPAYDVTVSATFNAIPTHEVKFYVNGTQAGETQNVYEGNEIDFPEDPADIGAKKFVGWATSSIEGEIDNAPEFFTSKTMDTEALNFYAVFATENTSGGESTVTLANSTIKNEKDGKGSYSDNYNIDGWTGRYLLSSSNSIYFLQLGYNTDASKSAHNSHLTTPSSTKTITSITISTNTNTASGRTFYLCDANDLGVADSDDAVYGSGSLSEDNGSVTINVTGSPTQVYIYPNGTSCVGSVSVTYSDVSYADYCTTISQNVIVSEAGWATACLPFNAKITSENATAYYVTGTTGENALEKKAANVIPAGTGVLLKSNDGGAPTVTFTASAEEADPATGNMLVGSLTDTEFAEPNTKYYILTLGTDNKVGFYWDWETNNSGASAKCPAGKAVLAVHSAGAKTFFNLDDEATGINSVEMNKMNNGIRYNLNGQAVGNDFKGVVIVNGKKFVK